MDYTLIRSSRRTLSIQIDKTGSLIARAPLRMSMSFIEDFIEKKKGWIIKHQSRIVNRKSGIEKQEYMEKETVEMKQKLLEYIVPRVEEIWKSNNLPKYTNIKITKSEHRWGSCSGKNGLCFSYRLAEYLPQCIDREKVHTSELHIVPGKDTDPLYALCTSSMHSPFIDAIIVHELAHLREKNHQKPFWNLVYRMIPEYEQIMKQQKIGNV